MSSLALSSCLLGMSRALLKLSGGSVHDYATISADFRVLTARRVPGGQPPARAYLDILSPDGTPSPLRAPGGHPAQHHRSAAPAFHMPLHMARTAEQTLDGVRGGERSLETLRQTHAEHGQRLVEPFPHARGRTRVVSVQAMRQVLQQTLGRLDVLFV